MDKVLNMGVDAWKCDGVDPIVMLLRPGLILIIKKDLLASSNTHISITEHFIIILNQRIKML